MSRTRGGVLVFSLLLAVVAFVSALTSIARGAPAGQWNVVTPTIGEDTTKWYGASASQPETFSLTATNTPSWWRSRQTTGYPVVVTFRWTKDTRPKPTATTASGGVDNSTQVSWTLNVPVPSAGTSQGAAILGVDVEDFSGKLESGGDPNAYPMKMGLSGSGNAVGSSLWGSSWPALRLWGDGARVAPLCEKEIAVQGTANLHVGPRSQYRRVQDANAATQYVAAASNVPLVTVFHYTAVAMWRSIPGTSSLEVATMIEAQYGGGSRFSYVATETVSGGPGGTWPLRFYVPAGLRAYTPNSAGGMDSPAVGASYFQGHLAFRTWSATTTDSASVGWVAARFGEGASFMQADPYSDSKGVEMPADPSVTDTGTPNLLSPPSDWLAWAWNSGKAMLSPFLTLFWPLQLITDWKWTAG